MRHTIQRLETIIRDLERRKVDENELQKNRELEINELRVTIQKLESAIRDLERKRSDEADAQRNKDA